MANLFKNLFGGKPATPPRPTVADDPNRPKPIHVSDADFDEVIMQADKLAIIDLWAEWCSPCHMLAPTIEDLAVEYDGSIIVAKLDVDHNPVTPGRFGIMGIPTVLFIKNGQEVDRIVGVQGYPAFVNRIERHLDV
ncbi:MAG TPA: thioredoxin [Caldilineae bacterium]|nr:thioredoxin [Caldilineae bacterium]